MAFYRACLLVLIAGCASVSNAAAADFAVLPAESQVATMAATEDGKLLILGHQAEDKLTVWDIATAQPVTEVKCLSPRHILARGEKIYVANFNEATISVYSTKTWKLLDEVEAGLPNPWYLSAPQGKHFKNLLVATCGEGNGPTYMAVDAAKDKHFEIQFTPAKPYYTSAMTVDYDGKSAFIQGILGHSISAAVTGIVDFRAAMAGQKVEAKDRQWHNTPILQTVSEGGYWFGGNQVWRGMPPQPIEAAKLGNLVIPDRTRRAAYFLTPTTIHGVALDAKLSPLGDQPATYPAEWNLMKQEQPWVDRQSIYFPQVAVTLDDGLRLYVYDLETKAVYFCKAEPFKAPALAVASSESPAAEPTPDTPMPPTAAPATDPAEFPAQVAVGVKVTFQLTAAEGAAFELASEQNGVTISKNGKLTWTPVRGDLGPQTLKIKVLAGDEVSFVRLKTEVLPPMRTAIAGMTPKSARPSPARPMPIPQPTPDPTRPTAPAETEGPPVGVHEVASGNVFLAYGLGGKSVLVLEGDKLRVLDATGIKVLHSGETERAYKAIFERPGHYVALADSGIDLLDKKTLQAKKEILLNHSQLISLAIHPTRDISYVSANDGLDSDVGPESPDVFEKQPVIEVNEATGESRDLPGVYGKWLATEQSGKHLFTGVWHIYKAGLNFTSPAGVIEEFGNVDVLLAYDVSGGEVTRVAENKTPGRNGSRLVVSPDGRFVSYVSAAGMASLKYEVPAFLATNINSTYAHYKIDGFCSDVSFHPSLDLVASINSNGAEPSVYRLKSGKVVTTDYLNLNPPLKEINRVLFSPDGRNLLVVHRHPALGTVLESIALNLKPEEQAALGKAASAPEIGTNAARTWTSSDGNFTIDAELVRATADSVTLKRVSDGKIITVPLAKLTEADREFARDKGK